MVFSNSVKPKFDLVLGFSWYLFWFNCQVTSKDCPWFFISQGKVKKSKILFCLVSHHESQYKLVYHKSWVGEVEEALLGNPCPTFLHFHVSPNYAVDTVYHKNLTMDEKENESPHTYRQNDVIICLQLIMHFLDIPIIGSSQYEKCWIYLYNIFCLLSLSQDPISSLVQLLLKCHYNFHCCNCIKCANW